MKKFIQQVVLFLLFNLVSFSVVFLFADGSTDAFYVKFATLQQKSLIVGSSRAAQGLIPNIIEGKQTDAKLYNYAFTIAHTAYGKAYYNSIEKMGYVIVTRDFVL